MSSKESMRRRWWRRPDRQQRADLSQSQGVRYPARFASRLGRQLGLIALLRHNQAKTGAAPQPPGALLPSIQS